MNRYVHADAQAAYENLYPDSRHHVDAWAAGRLEPRSSVVWSSQALCISVFGTLAGRPARRRDSLLGAILDRAGMIPEGIDGSGVEIACEERARGAVLNELGVGTPTSLDVLVEWRGGLLAVESKFCEPGFGRCSQPTTTSPSNPLADDGTYLPNCSGNFERGSDSKPSTASAGAPCRLMVQDGRRTPRRYWEVAPNLFRAEAITAPRRPCPFADDSFQLMRNLEFAQEAAHLENPTAWFGALVTYVEESPHAADIEAHLRGFSEMLLPEARPHFGSVSYEEIATLLDEQGEPELSSWLEARIRSGISANFGP